MTCAAAEPLIGRYADHPLTLAVGARQELELHLAACAGCRAALGEQQAITRALRSRPPDALRPGFAARLAVRLDAEPQGVLGLANWRVWTATLAPLAAALVFAAWTGIAAPATPPAVVSETAPTPETFASWTEANAGAGQAAVFLQSSTGDVLIESILVGTAAPLAGRDGR